VVIVPAVLVVRWVHWSALRWPTDATVARWVNDPLTAPTIVGGALICAGLLWLATAVVIVGSMVGRLRRGIGWLRRVPLPTPAQATATSLAGVAVFGAADTATNAAHVDGRPATPTADAQIQHRGAAGQPAVSGADIARAAPHAGVDLPDGGWMPVQTAQDVAAAATMLWWRRRRFYRPHEPGTPHDDDPDARPLPTTVTTAQSVAQSAAADPTVDARTISPPGRLPQAVLGRAGDGPLPADQLPAGPLHLVGPGAQDAARGLLVTVLLTAQHDRDGRVLVVTSADDLTRLLGGRHTTGHTIGGLQVVDTIAAARQLIDDGAYHDGGPSEASLIPRPPQDRQPSPTPVVVLTHTTGGSVLLRRLDPAPTANATVTPPAGQQDTATWQVDADGTTADSGLSDKAGARLCVLSERAAVDLLTVLHDAYHPARDRDVRPGVTQATATDGGLPAPTAGPVPPGAPGGGRVVPPLRLHVLGRPALTNAGEPVTLRRSAALQALVMLAVHHPDGCTARQLTEALWPGPRPAGVSDRLYTTMSELRRTLRSYTADPVVHRDADQYRLNTGHLDVDLWHLHTVVRDAAAALTIVERQAALRSIISRYTGELGADQPWPWLDAPREVLRRHVIDAYAALADTSAPDEALSPPFVTVAALTTGWLIWAALCATVLLRLVALLPHTLLRRWPMHLPGPQQSLATAILGAATISATAHTAPTPPAPAAATENTSLAGSPGTVTMQVDIHGRAMSALDTNDRPRHATRTTTGQAVNNDHRADNDHGRAGPATAKRAVCVPRDKTATVHRGDSLWTIARRCLGNAHRWPEIFALNRGAHFPASAAP
jgi:nucleoid-associated protein YgaU